MNQSHKCCFISQPHSLWSFLLALPQQVFCSPEPPAKTSTPEDFIRMTKGITMATAKAVAAGNSCRQEDVIATANLSRRAIADMLRACKVEIPAVPLSSLSFPGYPAVWVAISC